MAIIANNLLCVLDKSNLDKTAAVSRICGIAFGETKLPKSMVSKPTFSKELIYNAFFSVVIKCDFIPCIASRGHSIIFTFFIRFKDKDSNEVAKHFYLNLLPLEATSCSTLILKKMLIFYSLVCFRL